MSTVRKIIFAVISMALGVTLCLLPAEILLRFLPYSEGLRIQPVNAANPILRFDPNRISTWSQGWDFEMVNRGVRTNNYGFRNDQNYDPSARTPLLAVIGDSNIESVMVPFPETTPARLAESAKGKGRVYSFAASGAGFGQHLAWAQYARDTFRPDGFIVLVISNDYHEALYKYKRTPAFHYFKERTGGSFDLVRVDYEPSVARRVLRHSALFMYLALNVRAYDAFSALFLREPAGRYVANMPAEVSRERVADMKRGVDAYLDHFAESAGVDRSRVLFVVDGLRTHLYDPKLMAEAAYSVTHVMNEYFIARARARGYDVIDMNPIFIECYAKDKRKFEFDLNTHLNGRGHEVVATAVAESRVFRDVFGATH